MFSFMKDRTRPPTQEDWVNPTDGPDVEAKRKILPFWSIELKSSESHCTNYAIPLKQPVTCIMEYISLNMQYEWEWKLPFWEKQHNLWHPSVIPFHSTT